jgi:hypothetical protein
MACQAGGVLGGAGSRCNRKGRSGKSESGPDRRFVCGRLHDGVGAEVVVKFSTCDGQKGSCSGDGLAGASYMEGAYRKGKSPVDETTT